jgi:1-acyl-sn-glycerol-3-phosphate acyltransferase
MIIAKAKKYNIKKVLRRAEQIMFKTMLNAVLFINISRLVSSTNFRNQIHGASSREKNDISLFETFMLVLQSSAF